MFRYKHRNQFGCNQKCNAYIIMFIDLEQVPIQYILYDVLEDIKDINIIYLPIYNI